MKAVEYEPWKGSFVAKFRSIDPDKSVNIEGKKGLPNFGPTLKFASELLLNLTDNRCLIQCNLKIAVIDIFTIETDVESFLDNEIASHILLETRPNLKNEIEKVESKNFVTLISNDGQEFICHSDILSKFLFVCF